jgi:hypothetical protein
MDLWVAIHHQNAEKLVAVLKEFGFDVHELSTELFLKENQHINLFKCPSTLGEN